MKILFLTLLSLVVQLLAAVREGTNFFTNIKLENILEIVK